MTFQPRDSLRSPRLAQPATFMRLPHTTDLTGVDVAILGVPFDGGASYRPGARLGPREIRAQSSLIRPYSFVQKVAPFERLNVVDAGDVDAPMIGIEKCYAAVEASIATIAGAGVIPLVAGGDHSISLPILRALAARHGPLGLVQIDAHIDTWDEYFGGKYFHGTPFRRAIEEGLVDPRRFVQVGIRGPMYGEDDFTFQSERGVTVVDIERLRVEGVDRVIERVRPCSARARATSRSTSTRSIRRSRPAPARPRWAASPATRRRVWCAGSPESISSAPTWSRCRRRSTARGRSPRCWRPISCSRFCV